VLKWVWSYSERPRSPAAMAAQRAVKLERMRALLAALHHPEHYFPALLVAGTKGKGSTVAMLSACLQAAGFRTGRYTSPHLINWRERTCIDAQPISTEAVVALAEPIRAALDGLDPGLYDATTFEVGTAFAFEHFAREGVDVAVVEVGTGGRLDATNLLEPLVSVIAPISYDHTPTLGETLSEIAWHKAGILRPGRPGILAPQVDEARLVVEREAASLGSHLEEVGQQWRWLPAGSGIQVESTHADFAPLVTDVALLGDHQRDNATAAVAALHALAPHFKVSTNAIRTGLSTTQWPGRLQILARSPLLVVDGAHNAASADVLRAAIEKTFQFERLHLVVGLSEGKDAQGVLHALAPRAERVYLTRSHHERSASPADLESVLRVVAPKTPVTLHDEVGAAVETALASARDTDLVLVTGSLFVVGEALVWWRRSPR
jgi:dihydrofolate synthase/folylpolyglutamate synthase